MGAESILYHARMRVLQSRKGSRRPKSRGTLPRLHTRQPCAKEKIVPPKEVLPRDRAFRYAYLRNHQPSGLTRIPSLQKPPDPGREEILERIRAVKRAKKDQKAREKAEKEAAAAAAATATASKAAKPKKSPTRLPRAPGSQMNSPTSVTALPPVLGHVMPLESRWSNDDTFSSEEEDGGSFAFLSEWSSLSSPSRSSAGAKRQQLPALR